MGLRSSYTSYGKLTYPFYLDTLEIEGDKVSYRNKVVETAFA